MSRKKSRKPQRTQESDPLLQKDALAYDFKRSRVSRQAITGIVPSRAPSAFGHLAANWLGAGMMAQTLRAIYESDDPRFLAERIAMERKGFRHKPQQLDFDILALIEASFPERISQSDLAERLNRTRAEVDSRLDYLRKFAAKMCGINILKDCKGSVGIADADLWMTWQNRLSKLRNSLRETQEQHGMSLTTVIEHRLTVRQEYPATPPLLLMPHGGPALPENAHD